MFRLRHTSVSRFPRCGLLAACHAPQPTPPSSNRTCGFPASGSPESSRLWHTPAQQLLWLSPSAQLRPQKGGISRRRTTRVQAVLPSSRLKRTSSPAPWLHGHYPVSTLLWACPTPAPDAPPGYVFPHGVWPHTAGRSGRVSQVPGLIFRRTPSPTTPESPAVALARVFTAGAGFTTFGRLTALTWRNEAETSSLALRLTSLPFEASLKRIAPPCARLATCVTSNSHGELLSVHEINQAWPGAPKLAEQAALT